ncbi:unnamed protein product [Candidula unifasciata]|uniref:F-box domain-containing protein n=1 Tax=Candidula unifasciata TaxID=100452 RepID=A0A8S3Z0T8_9EUPU|nr:unnamed protein product [Candidula unifasciata]
MKVRVKLGSRSQTILLEQQDPANVRLQDLRQSVSREFHLQDVDFQLSLNKQDALSGEDQTLDAFGIVSGDLLHIIGSNLSQAVQVGHEEQINNRVQPLAPYSNHDSATSHQTQTILVDPRERSPVSSSSSRSRTSGVDVNNAMDVSTDKHIDQHDLSTVSDINRYMQEPLVIRESTEHQVPVLLSQLYSSAGCSSDTDALWVAVHTLMLESGFVPLQTQDAAMMPSDFKRPGYYLCSYNYVITADASASCSVVGVTAGASIIAHGLAPVSPDLKTDHLQLKSTEFVRTLSQDAPATYRALDKLSRLVKDTICLTLINKLVTAAGFPERQGLQALPYETKLRVTSFLDARSLCHLGQTCREFNTLHRDKTLWRILYIRTFGKPDDCSLSRNWYEMFKVRYRQYKEEQDRRNRILYVDETDPPWGFPGSGPFRPANPGLPFPHLVGGDYDVNPEYASGNPNPFGGRRSNGPLLPRVNIPDPLFPEPGFGLPGQPRPGAGSLTGSPFSGNWRGPFM